MIFCELLRKEVQSKGFEVVQKYIYNGKIISQGTRRVELTVGQGDVYVCT